ncbi:MAG: hypothetical protein ACE5IR_22450, partial [bacterium]
MSLLERFNILNAELGAYYGGQHPRVFTTVAEEHSAARNTSAIMARPYLGILRVMGTEHTDLLHRITTNELRNLNPGDGQINIFANEKGKI